MVTQPLISFITVTYQAEAVLPPTLDRLLEQTDLSFECLVIDGGSTDGTLALIKDYEAKFAGCGVTFTWISEPDKGLYHAMNKGLAMAQGVYVWFMNAGDRLAGKGTIQRIKAGLTPVATSQASFDSAMTLPDFIYGETTVVDDGYNVVGARRLKAPAHLTWKQFKWGMLVCHQAMVVKRSLAPAFDLHYRYSSDFDWAIRCLKQATSIHNTNLVLCDFLHGGLTTNKMKSSLKERFVVMTNHYGLLSTLTLHGWFIIRAGWFKVRHGWL